MSLIGAAFGASVQGVTEKLSSPCVAQLFSHTRRICRIKTSPIVEHEFVRELFHLPQRGVSTSANRKTSSGTFPEHDPDGVQAVKEKLMATFQFERHQLRDLHLRRHTALTLEAMV